ncbi:hypothetical protein RFI_11347, partial [Reticulomyxa filosa]
SSSSSSSPSSTLHGIKKDAYDLLQTIPLAGSHSLRVMILKSNVLLSFGDTASLTNIPLPTLFRLAAHLTYWGKAKIINVITPYSMFVINPHFNFNIHKLETQGMSIANRGIYVYVCVNRNFSFVIYSLAYLSVLVRQSKVNDFAKCFPTRHSLWHELDKFNFAHPFSFHLKHESPSKKEELMCVVIWLLQREFIVEIHNYISLLPCSEFGQTNSLVLKKLDDSKESSASKNNFKNSSTSAASSNFDSLFQNLMPYIDGHNTEQEIMFQTGNIIQIRQLREICQHFRSQIAVSSHFSE